MVIHDSAPLIIDTYGLSLIIEPIIVNHLESHSSYKNFRSLYVGLCLKMICYKNDKWRLNINIPPLRGHMQILNWDTSYEWCSITKSMTISWLALVRILC